jgi:lysophospholipase L1-like esterase
MIGDWQFFSGAEPRSRESSASPHSSIRVAIVGDSIVGQMMDMAAEMPGPLRSAVYISVGGNATTAQIAGRIRTIPPGTTHVIIEGGINDLASSDRKSLDEGSALDLIAANYDRMLQRLPPDMPVHIFGILPIEPAKLKAELRDKLSQGLIDDTNFEISMTFDKYANCTMAEDVQAMDMTGLTIDGIHPNAAGFRALARVLMMR